MATGRFYHAAVCDERGQGLTDIAGSHSHDVSDLLLGEGFPSSGEDLFDAVPAGRLGGGGSCLLADDLQSQRMLLEFERQPVSAWSCTMLDAELQLPADATQEQIR
jgi:hypothetical protein